MAEAATEIGDREEVLIGADELARKLDVTRRTLQTLIKEKKIHGMKVGHQWRFRFSEVERELRKRS